MVEILDQQINNKITTDFCDFFHFLFNVLHIYLLIDFHTTQNGHIHLSVIQTSKIYWFLSVQLDQSRNYTYASIWQFSHSPRATLWCCAASVWMTVKKNNNSMTMRKSACLWASLVMANTAGLITWTLISWMTYENSFFFFLLCVENRDSIW